MGLIINEDIYSNKLDDGIMLIALDKTHSIGKGFSSIIKDVKNIFEKCLEEKIHVKICPENGRCICYDCK